MQYITYLLLRSVFALFGIIPFRMLYVISDGLAFLLHRVFRYRRKVVASNLQGAFPHLSVGERKGIEKRFYTHLADVTLETIKGMSMSRDDFYRRHHCINPGMLDAYYHQGKSAVGVPAHYGNWEWGVTNGIQIEYSLIVFYKPMNNKYVDAYMRRLREKFDARLTPIADTYRAFSNYHDKQVLYVMAADQSPSSLKRAHWLQFLNRDTACLHGPARYARQFNLPVVYVHIERIKRGFYELTLKLLSENPASLPEEEITRLYMAELEQHILRRPENWLWSHRRWKHQR